MTEIYCSLDEAYGSDFKKKLDIQKPLSNTKVYNSYIPKKTPNNNFDSLNGNGVNGNGVNGNRVNGNGVNGNDNKNRNFLENSYNDNHTLLLKIINENKKLNEKLDLLLSQSKNKNITDIILYIISGILVILFIDMIIRRISKRLM